MSPKEISFEEEHLRSYLPFKKAREYKYTRSYTRFALSNLFKIDPIEIPLIALPGKPPLLQEGWGHISISHCHDLLLIGWSPEKIGVDIERIDRSFSSNKILDRYLTLTEKEKVNRLNKVEREKAILSHWVIKEASLKWQRGSLFKDLFLWEWNQKLKSSHHKLLDYKVNVEIIKYKKWLIGIAFDKKIHPNNIFFCQH